MDDISKGVDRVSAILAGSWLDLRLEGAVKAHMIWELTAEETNLLFGEGAPIGTFGAKINTAYAMGIIGPSTRDALRSISKVRNAFAHAPITLAFDTPEIDAECQKLFQVSSIYAAQTHLSIRLDLRAGSPRDYFVSSSMLIFIGLAKYIVHMASARVERLGREKEHLLYMQEQVRQRSLDVGPEPAPLDPIPFLP